MVMKEQPVWLLDVFLQTTMEQLIHTQYLFVRCFHFWSWHTARVGNVYLQHTFFQPVYPCFYSNCRSTSWLKVHLHTVPDEWQLPGSGPAVRDPPECNSRQYRCSGQHGGVRLSDRPVPPLRLTDRKAQQQRSSRQWSSDEWLCQTGTLRHADTVSCHWSVINSDSQWSFHNDGLEFTVSLCPLCTSFL